MSFLKLMTEQTAGDATPAIAEGEVKNQPYTEVVTSADQTGQETALYVATNLRYWETAKPDHFARDVRIDETLFRRLDPEYYAWLSHKLTLAEKAADSGRLSSRAFETLRTRFNDIHAWAANHFGEDTLASAMRSLDVKAYVRPEIVAFEQDARHPPDHAAREAMPQTAPQYLFPKESDWPFTQEVSPSAVIKVDAIRDQALSLGWSEARLYQNRGRLHFPCGED